MLVGLLMLPDASGEGKGERRERGGGAGGVHKRKFSLLAVDHNRLNRSRNCTGSITVCTWCHTLQCLHISVSRAQMTLRTRSGPIDKHGGVPSSHRGLRALGCRRKLLCARRGIHTKHGKHGAAGTVFSHFCGYVRSIDGATESSHIRALFTHERGSSQTPTGHYCVWGCEDSTFFFDCGSPWSRDEVALRSGSGTPTRS